MKKSEMYRLAQGAVINYQNIDTAMKLEILRELMSKEDVALYVERKEEEEKKTSRENQQYEAV